MQPGVWEHIISHHYLNRISRHYFLIDVQAWQVKFPGLKGCVLVCTFQLQVDVLHLGQIVGKRGGDGECVAGKNVLTVFAGIVEIRHPYRWA